MERVLLVLMVAAALLAGCAGDDKDKLPAGTIQYEVSGTIATADITYHDETGLPIEVLGHTVFPWQAGFAVEESERDPVTLYVKAVSAVPGTGATLTVKISIDNVIYQLGTVTGDADLSASVKDTY